MRKKKFNTGLLGQRHILVFNVGSSSLSFKIFKQDSSKPDFLSIVFSGKAHRVGVKGTESSFIEYINGPQTQKIPCDISTHTQAAYLVLHHIKDIGLDIDLIGHRFVHGGRYFKVSSVIDKESLKKLRLCLPLAPLHNPISLDVITVCSSVFPDIPQFVCFDTAFHSRIPEYAYAYALPKKIVQKFGFRKYGFHGLSYADVLMKSASFLKKPAADLKAVICHIGTGGSSVAAIKNGHSIDTSMGYSPLPGLVMSTRCGDIDPMLTLYLMAVYGLLPDELSDLLNKKSGLLGISDFSSDIRDIVGRTSENGSHAQLAFDIYIHRLKKYIGSYVIALGGIDVLAFTDDIGIRNRQVRQKICENMQWAGIVLDGDLDSAASVDNIRLLNSKESKAKVLSVPNDEEYVIAKEGLKLFKALR
jgi:acetate kinase